jgi:hypothetical protein
MKEAANRGGLKCLLFFLRSHHVEAGSSHDKDRCDEYGD